MPVRPSPLLRCIAVVAAVVAGCGQSADTAAACIELREPEDPSSQQHVIDDDGVQYLTTPPTSGPHIAGPTPSGVLQNPVAEPIQVRLLEAGGVMVNHDPQLPEATIAELSTLAGDNFVVAPSASVLDHPIVVTAWTWKLICTSADLDAIETFATNRAADAPGLD